MKKILITLLMAGAFTQYFAQEKANAAEIVDFYIISGTGSSAWNTERSVVETKVGQTLRFHNEDNVTHILHTNGAPCAHSPEIKAGTTWDCVLSKEYSFEKNGAIYDHTYGDKARFYLITTK